MSTKKFCQECGTPSIKLTAKFCGNCGNPFDGNVRAAAPVVVPEPINQPVQVARPQRPQRASNRPQVEDDVVADDDDTVGGDANYVPAVDALEVDIEVYDNRQKIGNLAGTSRSDFNRPPEKVPKTKKDFREKFLSDWQKEAGTQRKKN